MTLTESTTTATPTPKIGLVAIGRNEGERLRRCLASAPTIPLVYVDSGSTDNSLACAAQYGATTVQLDMTVPFTAARARNAGVRQLLADHPDLAFVMFVDGDCEIQPDWIERGCAFLNQQPQFAAVCGRRREKFPQHSVWNTLCDIEWDTPIGEAEACGGDAIYALAPFHAAGGFDDGFIAGEEPELCFRIRHAGFKIMRLDAEMTLHDADMTRLSQWWKRMKRSGYAYFLSYAKHGQNATEPFKRKEVFSILFWGGGLYASLLLSLMVRNILPVGLYTAALLLQTARVARYYGPLRDSHGRHAPMQYAFNVMFGKIPQLAGITQGWLKQRTGKKHTLVEYK